MGAKELMAKLARRKEGEAAAVAELWQSLFPEYKAVPELSPNLHLAQPP